MSSTESESGTQLPTDYDDYAPTYAWSRWPLPWVLEPLTSAIANVPAGGSVLEIGCGTGNYIRALCEVRTDVACCGLDLSFPMLREARRFGSRVRFARGDAARALPLADASFHLAYTVDVIHHIENLPRFFVEAHRVLAPGGELILVTDSDDTMRRRSLTRFFPETLEIELSRYPQVPRLNEHAARAGFTPGPVDEIAGQIPLDDHFMAALEAKCSSSVRLIPAAAHSAGMRRIGEARAQGESWTSVYVVLRYLKRHS